MTYENKNVRYSNMKYYGYMTDDRNQNLGEVFPKKFQTL